MKVFRLFYISLVLLAMLALVLLLLDLHPLGEDVPSSPESLLARVDTDDYMLRARATELSAGCADKECAAHRLFAHVRDNESLANHSDRAVLFASYMENLAIHVQITFAGASSSNVLACGLDRKRLYQYMLADSLSTPFHTDNVRLADGQSWTKVIDAPEKRKLAMRIEASRPVELTNACKATGQLIVQACDIQSNELLSIFAASEAQIAVTLAYIDVLEQDIPLTIYQGRNCVPFEFDNDMEEDDARL